MDSRRRTNARGPTSTGGATLVEAVLVIVVLSIVGLSSTFVVVGSMGVYARTAPALEVAYQTRLAAERFQRDVRELGDPASVTAFSATSFAFTDRAGAVVRYEVAAGELRRNDAPLARGVTAAAFRYRARDGAPAATPAVLHLVELDITVDRAGQWERLVTTVFPRGLAP